MNASRKYKWKTIKCIYVEDHGAVSDVLGSNRC